MSILVLLKDEHSISPRKSFYYYYKQNSLEALQDGGWKLVFDHPGLSYEGFKSGVDGKPGPANGNFQFMDGLHDLRRNPGERYNMQDYYPEIVEKLQKIAQEAREDLGDDLTGNSGKNRRKPGLLK